MKELCNTNLITLRAISGLNRGSLNPIAFILDMDALKEP